MKRDRNVSDIEARLFVTFAVFERLSKHLKHIPFEFWQLVEEQHEGAPCCKMRAITKLRRLAQ